MSEEAKPRPYQLFMLGLCVYVLIALVAQTFFPLSEGTNGHWFTLILTGA